MNDYAKSRRNQDERNGTAGIVLHQSTGSTRQGDCDRRSIRVFEERLATEPHGDWLSGTRDAQKAVGNFIIETAKDNNFFIPQDKLSSLGEKKRLPSGESVIYENAAQGMVYKVRDPFAKFHLKSGHAIDVLYDHVAHNLLFPEAQYSLVGITTILEEVRFILAQEFFYTWNTPTQQQIDEYLNSIGLCPEDKYYYGNEYLSVTDVSANSDNVLINNDGKLLFIDPIIKLKMPIDDVINAYPFAKKDEQPKKPQGLLSFFRRIFGS